MVSQRAFKIAPRRNPTYTPRLPLRVVIIALGGLIMLLYTVVLRTVIFHDQTTGTPRSEAKSLRAHLDASKHTPRTYQNWKELVIRLAGMTPTQVLATLENDDPFGVRTFERKLVETESQKAAFLDVKELRDIFPCPNDDRITLPDQRDRTKEEKFRHFDPSHPTNSTFLFFQHLRKAGGTNFCALANKNIPKAQVPSYYCMPDYHWSKAAMTRKCAGCFSYWTNDEIVTNMHAKGHRILGNEWDAFEPKRFFDLPALFATSFRKPLHRALSQFRFECIEDRGCKIKAVEEWWKKRKDLKNVYAWTFTDQHIMAKYQQGLDDQSVQKRQKIMGEALDTVAKFNIVLVMEWLAYAPKHVTDVLGFENTVALTERVRPHINQHQRDDGQEKNSLGAAGIAKASWSPENYLSKEQYKIMSEDLALDEILTDAARRMFLERIVCEK